MENKRSISDSLNLCNTLKNLTLHYYLPYWYIDNETFIRLIQTVLTKKYFYNLDNVTILIDLNTSTDGLRDNDLINNLFSALKQNKKALKSQFKEFTVGLRIHVPDFDPSKFHTFHIMKWNSKIDDKYLDQLNKTWCQFNRDTLEQRKAGSKLMR